MTKRALTLLALATLAACEATTGPADPMADANDRPAQGTAAPGTQAPGAAPWWAN